MIHCCRFASFATTCRSPLPIRHPKSKILSSMPYLIYLLSSRRLRRMKYRESYRYCYNWRSRNRTLTEWDIVKHVIFYIFVVYCCVSPHLPPSILWSTERATATSITGRVGIGHPQSEILSSMPYFIYLLSIVACPLISPPLFNEVQRELPLLLY